MPLTLDGLLLNIPIMSYHYETQKADSCPLYLTRPAFQQLAPTMEWKDLVPERITNTETWVGWSQWASTNFPKHTNIENHGTNIEEHSKTHRCWNPVSGSARILHVKNHRRWYFIPWWASLGAWPTHPSTTPTRICSASWVLDALTGAYECQQSANIYCGKA